MTLGRTTAGINKAEDVGRMDAQIMSAKALQWVFPTTVASYSRFMARFARRQQGTGRTNCRLPDVLSSAACALRVGVHGQQCDIWGILLLAVSGCCYNNGGLRNRRWANAITKHGGKDEWLTSVQSLPFLVLKRRI